MPEADPSVDSVAVAASDLRPLNDAAGFEFSYDFLNGPFGDSYFCGNLSHDALGITVQADQHMRVV